MQTESEACLESDAHHFPDNGLIRDEAAALPSSTPDPLSEQPVKKPTRQWAAWTRQEEESFFTALRQVGKNFEKITRRVQSKNKDQVRHYYYRLVRRMNKLLGPALCLDAKNSKDTNAAMLRWWSLLEKYSCKASKLHLKPRRFKIFIEALEHQLLKDRKRNVRKRPSQVENCPPAVQASVSSQNRMSGLDGRAVKLVLVDSQNIPRLGSGKTSLKRNANAVVSRGNKVDSTSMKPMRQRRKSGVVSSAAYKKWEKAAMAGVSLVADAAEHLERTAIDKETVHEQGTSAYIPGERSSDVVGGAIPPLPANLAVDTAMNTATKLKLQLFPIDDRTRRSLEKDKHNPYLELTLSTRKKISSVLEHISRKWGHSSAASGELILFPYNVQRENLVGCQRWTQKSNCSAAEVHAIIGSPCVFRLRYGWFSNLELETLASQAPEASCSILDEHDTNVGKTHEMIISSTPISAPSTTTQSSDLYNIELDSVNKRTALASSSISVPSAINECLSAGRNNNLVGSSDRLPWDRKNACDGTILRSTEHTDNPRLCSGIALSAGEWADSLTNISIGDLLEGVPHDMDDECIEPPVAETSQCLQQIPFSCDSFDAAIAAHISNQQDKFGCQPSSASHVSSIWDADETCDAFSFQKSRGLQPEVSSSCFEAPRSGKESIGMSVEELPHEGLQIDNAVEGDPTGDCQSDVQILENSGKNFSEMTDMYWPDSLGLLDLEIPTSKYHSEDLIISDSGLNRLIASSLDAFQNCSFFGLDRKESASTVEAQEAASFPDFKISS